MLSLSTPVTQLKKSLQKETAKEALIGRVCVEMLKKIFNTLFG
jgi:hypothetical protein